MLILNYSILKKLFKKSPSLLNITNQGYIKRSRALSKLKKQKRGGKVGKSSIVTRDEDFVVQIFISEHTHTSSYFFSIRRSCIIKLKLGKFQKEQRVQKVNRLFNILTIKKSSKYQFYNAFAGGRKSLWKNLH